METENRKLMMTEQILGLLEWAGMSQKQLAAKLGVSGPTLSKKLKYDDWRESDLHAIAKACGVNYQCSFYINEE